MTPSARWRRLDLPGTDEAHLLAVPGGHTLGGMSRFEEAGSLFSLSYLVEIDAGWTTRSAVVMGTGPTGPCQVIVKVMPDGTWIFNGDTAPAVTGCIDFDLGFTPATNLLSIRRLELPVGNEAEVTVAWLPSPDATSLEPLRQVYRRISADRYYYSCPDLPFESTLRVDENGFVLDYPPLWEERDLP